METKALKKQLGAAIAMVIVAASALGAATFAWFVNNNRVVAEGVNMSTTSSVPNLYINQVGNTSAGMTPGEDNPSKLYPVSTGDAKSFFETLHWTNGNAGHVLADQYQSALKVKENDGDKNKYEDYTFKLGVTNGKMDVYFDAANATSTLKANGKMGTAGRFAVKVGNSNEWLMFKLSGTETGSGYYTDKNATEGDYWVASAENGATTASYLNFADYAGSVDAQGQAVAGKIKLTTIGQGTDKEVEITVRVWYEGCDKDCVSENASDGIADAVTGNLGFVGVASTTQA